MGALPIIRMLEAGPVDVVADVHGELEALEDLLGHLGYSATGTHPDGRRLVFLGDLVDRGPDSPGVVNRVRNLIDAGVAECVIGNHELGLMRHKLKPDNRWFYAQPEHLRAEQLAFFDTLPLALERDDLRCVHAAWCDESAAKLRRHTGVLEVYREFDRSIQEQLMATPEIDHIQRLLLVQNGNPIKRMNSGPEEVAPKMFLLQGEPRYTDRLEWWNSYDGPLCIVGHYWRGKTAKATTKHLFDDARPYSLLGRGQAMCIDYSVGWRFYDRLNNPPGFRGPFNYRLAAYRFPEHTLAFDDGTTATVEPATPI